MQKEFLSPIKRTSKDLTVVILGALSMYRNKGIGPMSLINVDGQTLSYRQMVNVQSVYPSSEIFLTTGYYANNVINNRPQNLRIIENQLYKSSAHAEELRLVMNASITDNYLIMDGNVLPDPKSLLSMKNHGSCILVNNEKSDCVGTSNDSGKLNILSYGLPNKWCKIALLQKSEVEIMKKFIYHRERCSYFLHEILNYIVNHKGNINVVKNNNKVEIIEDEIISS